MRIQAVLVNVLLILILVLLSYLQGQQEVSILVLALSSLLVSCLIFARFTPVILDGYKLKAISIFHNCSC
jgi:hypothetical protein